MIAFHSNWTAPFFTHGEGEVYNISDFELLTTLLSALEWRKVNGSIKMVTDEIGAAYYHRLGIDHIWDLGVELSLTQELATLDPSLFWAAGKLFALRQQDVPCVMLDTDLIIWNLIPAEVWNAPLVTMHRETLMEEVYPDSSFFDLDDGYTFPHEWNWTVLPCNTAFLYLRDWDFKAYYTDNAIRFMKNLKPKPDAIVNMVFAEQRLLAMCVEALGVPIKTLLDLDKLRAQNSYTHIWGYKSVLQKNDGERIQFCFRCIRRILKDFPEERETLSKIECLVPYMEVL